MAARVKMQAYNKKPSTSEGIPSRQSREPVSPNYPSNMVISTNSHNFAPYLKKTKIAAYGGDTVEKS